MDQAPEYQKIKNKLSDRWWRLNSLYYIKNKQGIVVKFKPNWAQEDFYCGMWYVNGILKARQLGFSTLIAIYMLDACLFNSNHRCGIIDYALPEAKKKLGKIKFAYERLPDWLKSEIIPTRWGAEEIEFSNGSGIVVGTSHRGDTLQKLHISEYGKISARYPEKAREIKTGALNAVETGQQVFVESTAEGKTGEFYDFIETARKLLDSGKKLARIEPKFFFYPWWKNAEYTSPDAEIATTVFTEEDHKYFSDLGIELSMGQKAWYVLKKGQQQDDMQQEFPSTPEEAFQGSLKGAFYTDEMRHIRKSGQVCHIPYNPKYPVYTWWDLGTNDLMTILFYQNINGKHCFIDYHESNLEGWDFYAKLLTEKGYNYASHNLPHDGNNRIRGAQIFTDKECAEQCGIRPIRITPRTSDVYQDIMNNCKPVLKSCWFDQEKCQKIITHLDNYRKRYSEPLSMFLKEPLHDEASHGADAFRTFAVNADNVNEIEHKKATSWYGNGF